MSGLPRKISDRPKSIKDRSLDSVSRSDHRRVGPHRLETAVGDGIIMANPSRALQHCQRTWDLLRDEGDSDMKMHSAYYDEFQMCHTCRSRACSSFGRTCSKNKRWKGDAHLIVVQGDGGVARPGRKGQRTSKRFYGTSYFLMKLA